MATNQLVAPSFAAALESIKGIGLTYDNASAKVLAFVLAARGQIDAVEFESDLAALAEAAPGVAKVTVGAYVSQARRVFNCPADKWAEVSKAAGKSSSLKAWADACPAIQKAKSESAKKRETGARVTKAGEKAKAEGQKTPEAAPLKQLESACLALRNQFKGKRAALALIGEIEDLIGDLAKLA